MRFLSPTSSTLLLLLASLLPAHSVALGQDYAWPPGPSRPTITLWPGTPPDATPSSAAQEGDITTPKDNLIAGRPVVRLSHVSVPTLTVYQPASNPTGAAVIVFPGGGYSVLAIDLEGTEVCQWLNSRNITCLVLKYRVPVAGPYPKSNAPLEDAQRSLALVRAHAAEMHLNPSHIGVLGFSAGGHLAAALSTRFDQRLYTDVDANDKASSRPDFAILIYPAYLIETIPQPNEEPSFIYGPDADIHPTGQTPPTFILQAEDDSVHVENATIYFAQLKAAHVPAELHLYAEGGHGYGLRATALPVTHWPSLAETWLHTINIIPAQ